MTVSAGQARRALIPVNAGWRKSIYAGASGETWSFRNRVGRRERVAMNEIPDKTIKAVKEVADSLDRRGHGEHAGRLRATLGHGHSGSRLRAALRDTCQIVLTAIEAIDPVCATMVEELRLEVDARLADRHGEADCGPAR
jgi:hypothetical protein